MPGIAQTVGLVSVLAQLALEPPTATVAPQESLSFTATGGTRPYHFELVTSASGGSITPDGVYTAGTSDAPDAGDLIMATDQLGRTGSASVTVANPYRHPPSPAGCASTGGGVVPLLGLLLPLILRERSRRESRPRGPRY